ncbi:complement factor B-like [Haemaphysalis longicornis]
MAGITGMSAFRVFTTLLPVLIVISTRFSVGAIPGNDPCSVPPPDLENGEYVGSQKDRLATYFCNDDFWLKGPSQWMCVTSPNGNDTWVPLQEEPKAENLDRPECHPFQDCEDPEIDRGTYDGDCCTPGNEVEFRCNNDRYALSGVEKATCLPDGTWSAPLPVCKDTYCKDPGRSFNVETVMILNGRRYMDECCPPGTALYHVCEEGYQLVGEEFLRCGANGTWDHARPKCKPEGGCDDFEVEHGRVTGERSGGDFFAPGDSAFVECDPGFRVNGTDQLVCEDDGSWDEQPPTCMEYNCTRFDPGPYLIVDEFEGNNDTIFARGTSINFRCQTGYLLQGAFSTTCRDGGWFGRLPKCEEIRCGNLRTPPNGRMVISNSTAVGSKASFGCFQGYKLLGPRERECQDYGEWSGSPVRCVPLAMYTAERRTSCMDPGTPDNGVPVGRSHFPIGSQVEFVCNPGYHRRGNATIRCLENGEWSARPPLCLGKYYFDDQRNVEEAVGYKLQKDMRPPPPPPGGDVDEAKARALILSNPNIRNYVYFLLDASTSIGERNFRHGINLAKAITRKVTVSEGGNRIGAVVFARNATIEINMLECTSTDDALQQLDNIRYLDGSGTSIKAGVEAVARNLHSVKNHLQGDHKNVKFSVFLITDGKANIGGGAEKVAKILGERKVEVYCIGITGSTDAKALKELASKPVETHFFILRNYDALQWLADVLTNDTTDYGVCGISNKHRRDTALEDDDKPRPRILGGERVVRSWPWMVEIRKNKTQELVSCGGTIIGRTWILTAAHCMVEKEELIPKVITSRLLVPADIRVRARPMSRKSEDGTKDLEGDAIELAVEKIILHENYNSTKPDFSNDIALLRLKENITYQKHVRPICLPPGKANISDPPTFYKGGQPAVVIGWGAEKSGGAQKSVERLKQLVKVIGNETNCTMSRHGRKYRPEGMMCASSKEGDSCQGDSGGPLMQAVEGEETVWTQVGIVSWGGKCKPEKFSFYTDVSYYVPWIRRHMDADAPAEAGGPGNGGDNQVADHSVVQH